MKPLLGILLLVAIAHACTFEDSGQRLGHATSHRVVLVDIDGDGFLDAVVANRAGPSTVWKNNGHGVFSPRQELSKDAAAGLNDYTWAVARLAGTTDVALLGDRTRASSASHLWRLQDTGLYAPVGAPLDVPSVRGAVSADLNGDGRPDLVAVGLDELTVLLMGDDDVSLTRSFADTSVSKSYGVDVGDLNGDGHPDLVVARTAGPNDLYLGDGAGSFALQEDRFPGSAIEWTRGVALGDLNGDGHLDVFFANRALGRVPASTVWYGDGAGGFTDSGQRLEARADSYAVVLTDVDGDGDLDAVLGNWYANAVLENDGSGAFAVSALAQTATFGTFGLAAGDLDRNGYPDLFFVDNNGGGEGAPNTVWLNRCHGPPPPPPPPTTTTTGGLPPQPPGETEGDTVVVQFEGNTPSARLIPIDHCGRRHEESAFVVRFATAVERDTAGNALKTVDFETSSFTYVRYDASYRFGTRAHDTDFTFDVALFPRDARISLEEIMGNVTFDVAKDSFKWSISMTQWPFWGDAVEQHTLELRVRIESGDGPITPVRTEPVVDAKHVLRYDVRTARTRVALRVLDVANVDGRPTRVEHTLDLTKEGHLRALVFTFPRFRTGIRFDPDVSVLLLDDGGDCGGESGFTELMAIASISIPVCVILVIGVLAALLVAQRARKWWHGRQIRRHGRKSINFDDDQPFAAVELEDMQESSSEEGRAEPPIDFIQDQQTGKVFPIPATDDDTHNKDD